MLNYQRALGKDRVMKSLTGLSTEEFQSLLPMFESAYRKHIESRKANRQRKLGGGSKHTLATSGDKLFFILFYLKTYPTFDVLGFFYDVDRSRPCRWVGDLLPVLEKALSWEVVLPARKIGSVEEFLNKFPNLKDIFIDGTERPTQRPSDKKKQRKYYSGKKQRHTHINLMMTDGRKRILALSHTKPGSKHDYSLLKKSGWGHNIPPAIPLWVDLGFLGIEKDFPHLQVIIPHKNYKKKPITQQQKQENKIIRTFRTINENAIAGVKRMNCVTHIFRNKKTKLADKFILVACGIWNYHLRFVLYSNY